MLLHAELLLSSLFVSCLCGQYPVKFIIYYHTFMYDLLVNNALVLHLALSGSLFAPDFTISDIPTAGDNFNFTCTVQGVAERLISGSFVVVRFLVPTGAGGSLIDESVYAKRYVLNPTRTNDAGSYSCLVTVFGASDPANGHSSIRPRNLQIRSNFTVVQFFSLCLPVLVSVPPPQLTLTISPSTSSLNEGSLVSLSCIAVLDSNVNSAVTVSRVWTGPSGEELTGSSRITVMDMLQSPPYTSVLVFNPVDDMDSGEYQCNMTVSQASNNMAILPSMNSTTNFLNITGKVHVHITVNDNRYLSFHSCHCFISLHSSALPEPLIAVSTEGSTEAGQNFSLICTVTTEGALSVSPNVTWVRMNDGGDNMTPVTANAMTTPNTTILTISFSPLMFSDRGRYQCISDLNIPSVTMFFNTQAYNLTVECE